MYAALPDRPFELDTKPKGAKAAWRTALVERVKTLASKQRRVLSLSLFRARRAARSLSRG